jgi:hypothetical protein
VERIVEVVQEQGMKQLVEFPIHIKGNILELLVTNYTEKVVRILEVGRFGKSDYMAILVELDIQVEEATIRQNYLNWRKARFDKIQ